MGKVKTVGKVALTLVGLLVQAVGYVVLYVAAATVTPISKAWHSGRLSVETAYAMRAISADQLTKLFGSLDAADEAHDDKPLGSYL